MQWLRDSFNQVLVGVLVLVALFLFIQPAPAHPDMDAEYVFFYLPSCPHCHEQMAFHEDLSADYPDLQITSFDVSTARGRQAYQEYLPGEQIRTPVTVIGNSTIRGFRDASTTGEQIRSVLAGEARPVEGEDESVRVFGSELDVKKYSLPALAVILGALDGFNPCAMWMLVYLLGLVSTIASRARRWLIIGVFLAASGVLYFLFLTAWLNAFLFVGLLRPVQILVGLFALGIGVSHLREYFATKGLSCDVGNPRFKKSAFARAERIVSSPMSLAVLGGIVLLAFAVNSIEFLCSMGIPAVFAQVLAVANISSVSHYALIAVYVFFYLLDDLIIVALAMFAIDKYAGQRYAKYCKLVTGVLLLALGVLLAFFPQLLF